MNYITAEQFLSLPEEVQKVFIDWWHPKVGDLATDKWGELNVIKNDANVMEVEKYKGKPYAIPLFRLDQLWEFVNTRYKHIGVNNYSPMFQINETTEITSLAKGNYKWNVKLFKSMMQFEPDIEVIEKDLLQAFWKAAVNVASGN